MSLSDILKERIRTEGPLTVAQFMEAALIDPDFGYYTTTNPLGLGGDFVTAPEISQVFGELIGAWLAVQWKAMGSPQCTLMEMGPGRGTLMADILRTTYYVPGFFEAFEVVMLEASPVLKQVQSEKLHNKHAYISWIRTLEEIPPRPLLFVANEFFDALPVRQFVGGQERCIGWNGDAFHFTPEGAVTAESCEAAEQIAAFLARHIVQYGGCGVVIDYGYNGGRQKDTFQAMSRHQTVDVLSAPGTVDLTAHVDFAALSRAAKHEGAAVYGPATQGAFLRRLGAEHRAAVLCRNATPAVAEDIMAGVNRLTDPARMGDIFKVLALAHPSLAPPEGFSQ